MSRSASQPNVKSKSEQKRVEPSEDFFSAYKHSVDKYFSEIKAITADYLQSLTDLQEELIESRKKNIDIAIEMQKNFATKLGTNIEAPPAGVKMIEDIANEIRKGVQVENKMVLTSINTLEKNISAYNENAKTFAELNAKILGSWAEIIKSTKNQ